MIFCEVENTFNVLFRFVVCEESRMWQMPVAYDFFPLTIRRPVLTPQVPLRIYNQPFPPSKALLEQRIPRGKRNAIVAAFDDEVDGAEHRFHFREAGCMMPEEVGSREGELGGKGGSREKGRHG